MKIYYIEHAFFKPVSPKHKKQFDWCKEHHRELHDKYGDGYYLVHDYKVIGVYDKVDKAHEEGMKIYGDKEEYIVQINTGKSSDYEFIPREFSYEDDRPEPEIICTEYKKPFSIPKYNK